MSLLKKIIAFIKPVIIYMLLIVIGVAGNYFNFPLIFGEEFVFGSIAVLGVVYLYGTIWGIIASVIVSSYTIVQWQHPYGIVIFICEALFVGLVLGRKNRNIVIIDMLYWIFIGMPLVWLFYSYFSKTDNLQLVLTMLKYTVNGIFNALIVNLIVTILPAKSFIFESKKNSPRPLNQMLFNLVVLFALCPSLIISIIDSHNEFNNIAVSIQKELKYQSQKTSGTIQDWQQKYYDAILGLAQYTSNAGILPNSELQKNVALVRQPLPDLNNIYICDAKGVATAFYPKPSQKGEPGTGTNFSDRPYFNILKSTLKPVITDAGFQKTDELPMIIIGAPIIVKNQFQGFAAGTLNTGNISAILKQNLDSDIAFTIIDKNNNVIASTLQNIKVMQSYSRRGNDEVYMDRYFRYHYKRADKDVPIMYLWNKSNYTYESNLGENIPWTVIAEKPLYPYQLMIEKNYVRNFSITLGITMLAFILAVTLSKFLSGSLLKLADVTTRLPEKIFYQRPINWPDSMITEVDILINNFKSTAYILDESFQKVRRANQTLELLAKQDPLTNLPNRILLKERLDQAIVQAGQQNKMLCVMFLDIDRFKRVNDTLGHDHGDQLLKKITHRLVRSMDKNIMLCRIGGDEFVVLQPVMEDIEESVEIATNILLALKQSFTVSGQELQITASIGIAVYPNDGEDSETLLKNADTAMYRAKELGKNNYQFYNPVMNNESYKNLKIENGLFKALKQKELLVNYQPRVDTESGRIVGAEALVRWNNPDIGMVLPAEFIPLAEETGLIIPVGEWVLRTACAQNKAWQDEGYEPVRVSVNISAYQFQRRDFVEKVSEVLKDTGLDPKWLELEITESAIIRDVDFTINALEKLKDMGVKVSLDDFGTGFSSLNYLKNFKIDVLKIDSSFVKDINSDLDNEAIVTTIIFLAKSLKLSVTAEGVESEAQLKLLRDKGCDEVQGYLFGKPMPDVDFKKMLRQCL